MNVAGVALLGRVPLCVLVKLEIIISRRAHIVSIPPAHVEGSIIRLAIA